VDERKDVLSNLFFLLTLWARCRLDSAQDAGMLDTLAAAHAEAGRFGEAESASQEALALSKVAGLPALAGQIEMRCRRYARQQPWREP